ncbi:XRE family transcriptional regulator [bacterium]|nr:XRE family transcriptional regulator [bacterium]
MEIGEQIKILRLKMNMSQDRFGKRIGVTGKTISAYETGKVSPSLEVLNKIASEFEVNFVKKSNKDIERKIDELQRALHELQNLFKESLSF